MEGRKLQLTGGSTYVVSLPKPWISATGLKPGDTVFLESMPDGSISVLPRAGEKPAARRKVFEEKGEETRDHLLRKLIGAYISGFGLIEVRSPPDTAPFVRRVARGVSRMAIGPEIIEETRTATIIQDLSDPAELSPEKCLRRMDMTVRAMLEDAIVALKTRDDALAEASLSIHEKTLDARLLKELEAASGASTAILDKAFSSLVTQDIDLANEAVDGRGPLEKMIDALSHHVAAKKGEELIALAMIVDSVGRAGSYATDIAEIAINSAVAGDAETP